MSVKHFSAVPSLLKIVLINNEIFTYAIKYATSGDEGSFNNPV